MAKTAAQYLAEAQAATAGTQGPTPSTSQPSLVAFKKVAKSEPQSPLNWLMDIVSRPLSGVTNVVSNGVDRALDTKRTFERGDVLGGIGKAAQNAVSAPGDFLDGLTSTDVTKHRTFSEVIEDTTDKVGKEIDPEYVDSEDNVNPWLKGIAGFVGDVALDPLTYIPGGVLLKGGKAIGQAARGATAGAVKAVTADKLARRGVTDALENEAAATRTAEAVAEGAHKLPEVSTPNAVEADAAKLAENADDAALSGDTALTPAPTPTEAILKHYTPEELSSALSGAGSKAVRDTLEGFKPVTKTWKVDRSKTAIEPADLEVTAKAAAKVTPADAMKFDKSWIERADDLALDMTPSQMPKVYVRGKSVPLTDATNLALKGDRDAIEGLRAVHADAYGPAFNAGMKAGHHVDALGTPIVGSKAVEGAAKSQQVLDAEQDLEHLDRLNTDPIYADDMLEEATRSWDMNGGREAGEPAPSLETLVSDAVDAADVARATIDGAGAEEVTKVMLTARENFFNQREFKSKALEAALGSSLVANLASFKSEAAFDTVLSRLKGILDESLPLVEMQKLDGVSRKLLEQIGLDTTRIPLKMRPVKAEKNVVAPPKTIEESVAKYEDKIPVEYREKLVAAVNRALGTGIKRDVIDPKGFKYRTATGAMTTEEGIGKGVANIRREMGTHNQATFVTSLLNDASEITKATKNLKGAAAANFKRDFVTQGLRVIERALDDKGIPVVMGLPRALADAGAPDIGRILLGQSQAIDVLDDLFPAVMQRAYWNYGSSVAPTNFTDAVFVAVKNSNPAATRQVVENMIRQQSTAYSKHIPNAKAIPNRIVTGITLPKGGTGLPFGGGVLNSDQLISELADAIVSAAPTLKRVVAENAAAMQRRGVEEITSMTDEHLDLLEEAYTNGTVGDFFTAVHDSSSRISQQAAEMGVLQQSEETVQAIVKHMVPESDQLIAATAVHTAQHLEQGGSAAAMAATKETGEQAAERLQRQHAVKVAEDDAAAVRAALREHPEDATMDLGDNWSAHLNLSFLQKMFNRVNRSKQSGLAHEGLRVGENMWRDMVGRTADSLNDLSRKWSGPGIENSRALWQEGMRALQTGAEPSNPLVKEHIGQLDELVSQMFGRIGSESLMDQRFFANNASLAHINDTFARYGLGKSLKNGGVNAKGKPFAGFDMEMAKTASVANDSNLIKEAAEQWRSWDIEDPAAFINTAYTSLAKLAADQSIVHTFMAKATEIPGAVSSVPKKGYSRAVNDSGKSIFAMYLNPDTYYRNEVLQQLNAADNLMQASLNLGDNGLGHFIRDIYKPTQDIWKAGMTLPNPTHHIRNLVSDGSLTFYAEGARSMSLATNKDAFHVMRAGAGYSNWDAIRALHGMGASPSTGKVVAKTRHGQVVAEELHKEMANRGLLPNFRTLETLDDGVEGTGKFSEKWRKVQHSKAFRTVGGISEARDHYSRLQHALTIVKKHANDPKFKSQEELFTYAANRVRKWHPDGSDLTSTEEAFKLIIPFYSWQRKTIPLIVESMLTNPARVTAIPKAQYNIAQAMGVDSESLADPFPDDQMFPSYMTNGMTGPTMKLGDRYYAVNPGFAANDILNDYASGEGLRAILGSTSPLIRAPFELATGAQVGTGAQINDTSDYVDSNLPFVGLAARSSGNSVTGSVVSALQGKGLDPMYQYAKGNKVMGEGLTPNDAVVNWLTGAGIQPMSQKNQINYAEIEKRDREKAATEGRSGF